jgi:hypothetical protein
MQSNNTTAAILDRLQHPHDLSYQIMHQKAIDDLVALDDRKLDKLLRWQMQQQAPSDDKERTVTKAVFNELLNSPYVPQTTKNILGSGGATGLNDGSPLTRQDLEPILYALFVRSFPAFERLRKAPSNGVVHAFNQISQRDPNLTSTSNTIGTVVTEIGAVSYTVSTLVRKTAIIAVFALGHGVFFKESAAVAQSPAHANSPLYFDGRRGQLGGYGAFAGNVASGELATTTLQKGLLALGLEGQMPHAG